MKPFPLAPWLEKRDIRPYKFAKDAGLALRTVYAYVNGERFMQCDPRCLTAIEAATDGEVTLRQMTEWMEQKRAEMEAQKEVA